MPAEPSEPASLPTAPRRLGRSRPGTRVLLILVLTCLAMLGAIYEVVHTAQP